MKEQTREDPKILAAAERQMQAWVHTEEIANRAIHSAHAAQSPAECAVEFITISRETGTGASEIARRLGQLLGWDVLDRNLLDKVAERFRVSRMMLDLVDETESSWVYDVLGTWMDRNIVTHDKYVSHLRRVVMSAGRRGKVVLVGRGAQFILPRQHGLAVRIVAPLSYRIQRVIERENLDEPAARRYIQQKDAGRREFVERHYHHDIENPGIYDLVINVERIGIDGAVEQILAAACRQPAESVSVR